MPEDPSTEAMIADPAMRNPSQRPARRWRSPALAVAVVATLAGLVLAVYFYRSERSPASPEVASGPTSIAASGSAGEAAAPATADAAASGPAVAAPAPPAAGAEPLPALDESDLVFARWLEDVFGREGLAQLRINDFARRFVATVDNLGREHAPARLWPVNPAAGRFASTSREGRTVIDADNSLRYAPFVILLEAADPARLAAVYRNAYPLLQQAYESLGYPGKTFHARLLEVIDHLLAAPEPAGDIELQAIEVRGPAPLTQPWRYLAFADPALEQLSAGQKLMVRMGPVNERRLKQVLSGLKAALTTPEPPR